MIVVLAVRVSIALFLGVSLIAHRNMRALLGALVRTGMSVGASMCACVSKTPGVNVGMSVDVIVMKMIMRLWVMVLTYS